MLKVSKIIPPIKEEIEIDEYIPLKVRWHPVEYIEERVYWYTGDLEKSLFEVGVAKDSGEIHSLTIVGVGNISFLAEDRPACGNIEKGMPVFSTSEWTGQKHVNEAGMFEIQCCNDGVILFLSNNHVVKEILSGRISFGLDKEMNVCKIYIRNLSDDEKYRIEDSLKWRYKSAYGIDIQ
jgi:hypothetical protein